jgi:hypothetical protein
MSSSGDEQLLVIADGRPHALEVAAGGDDVVAGSQGSPGEVNAHAATGAGDQPGVGVGGSHAR